MMQYYSRLYPSPIGTLRLVGSETALAAVGFPDGKYQPDWAKFDLIASSCPVLEQTADWLDRYFAGTEPGDTPPLAPLPQVSSPFRQLIWSLLTEIPYGGSTTYGALAAQAACRLGRSKMSAQAIGGAVGHNPIPILIPCHRVLGANGALAGYAGGLERKRFLLELEGWQIQGEKTV